MVCDTTKKPFMWYVIPHASGLCGMTDYKKGLFRGSACGMSYPHYIEIYHTRPGKGTHVQGDGKGNQRGTAAGLPSFRGYFRDPCGADLGSSGRGFLDGIAPAQSGGSGGRTKVSLRFC